ncbi:diguanylate cyclase [Thermotoga sp. KOL6]|nr:diguanylate cyclase [Thermotoga sp. KOL6]
MLTTAAVLFFLMKKKIAFYTRLEKSFDIIVEGLSKLDPEAPEEEFFQNILDIAMKVVPEANKGSVSRITEEGDWIFVASKGHTVDLFGRKFPARYLFRAGKEPVEVNFLEYDNGFLPDEMWDFFKKTLRGTRMSLVVGLFAGDEFLGNIALDSPREHFSDLSKKVLKSLGNLASTYLLLKNTLKREQYLQRVLKTIFTLLLLFRKQISIEDFLNEALQKILESTHYFVGGAVFRENEVISSVALEEIPQMILKSKEGTGKIETIEEGGKYYVIVHLEVEELPSYSIIFTSKTSVEPSFLGVLNTFAEITTIYIKEHQLHQKYREIALRDTLTGAYTRHYFNEWIYSHMAWLRRNQKTSVLVIFDLDGLKMINDTYGHLMGDKTLKEFVRILKETVRESDPIFRYGGDEFLLVLVDSKKENTPFTINRLRKNLRKINLPFEVDFSVGYEEIDGFIPIEKALARADDLLYRDKFRKRGENK